MDNAKKLIYSELSIFEFRKRLEKLTKTGHPNSKKSLLFRLYSHDYSKKFYGLYDDKTYSLTVNWLFTQTSYKLRGNYKIVNRRLQIQYEIVPIFKYTKIIICLFFVFIIFTNLDNKFLVPIILLFTTFLGFIFILLHFVGKIEKDKLEREFIKVSEVCINN